MGSQPDYEKRRVLAALMSVLGFAAANTPTALLRAAERLVTPAQPRGPFYPLRLPLDSDNDLVSVQGSSKLAEGETTNIVGRILNECGRPVQDARLEIWQCDANGRYRHPWDSRDIPLDANFQGYGAFTTGHDGMYRFRTIKPVPYPGRAPHIHFAIKGVGIRPLVTQMYVAGAPENQWDGLLNSIGDRKLREQLIVKLEANPDQSAKFVGTFDIVLAADGRFAGTLPFPA